MTTTQVNAGDLITAELMNEILTRLGQHDALLGQIGGAGPQTIVVPAVYGRTLTDARAIITAPTAQLAFGSVIDAAGNVVNPNLSQSLLLPVISQMPPAGTRVAPQTSVDLLVAATSPSGPSQPLPSVNSITQSSAPVNSEIDIFGANFASLFSLNTVRFNGQPGTVSATSNTQHLIVRVPATIPGAPNAPGGQPLAGVAVSVATPAGTAASSPTITVTAPVPTAPTITATNPAPPNPAIVTGSLVITGTNFSATQGQNSVTIDGLNAPVTLAGPTSLTVTVPLISGLNTIPSTRNNVPVVVRVSAIASNTATINVTRLS
ncbi:MAG TPA: IPT/TIG domain-containing protein [Thermoanaerobaculia bacterium]|nr:IPT/TIG domain-containing protein [Thermoanaerobaculia bacterium]